MTLRKIVTWPDPRLSMVCDPVDEITPEIEALAADMLETMYAAPGRGLAAPQVGALQRLFVMDTEWKDRVPAPMVFINPEILVQGATSVVRAEGCLSIPGVVTEVSRPDRVQVRWTDIAGNDQQATFDGFAAACVQHELDHLNGTVTLDRLDPQARALALETYNEALA